MDVTKRISALILAAGFSERMGSEKFALKYDDKYTFLEKLADTYVRSGCNEIAVVMNTQGLALLNRLGLNIHERVKLIENKHPEKERFYSLQIGLKALSECDFVYIQNIDNPFTEQGLLELLSNQMKNDAYTVPYYQGKGGHPIVISRSIADAVIANERYDVKLNEFLKLYLKIKVETGYASILNNINDQDIYMSMFRFTDNLKSE